MSNTGGKRAWEFLQRNLGYREEAADAADAPPAPMEPAPFPMRVQTEADLAASKWGLLAWEDPLAVDGPASPFWAEAPVLAAEPSASPPVAALAAEPGWRVSGLRLADGPVVLKVEHGRAAAQLRVADGAGFDPAAGVRVWTSSPADLLFPARLRQVAGLWPAVAVDSKKADGESRTTNSSRCSTAGSPGVATA